MVYFTYVKSADKDKRDWTRLNVENAAGLKRVIWIFLALLGRNMTQCISL